MCSDKQMVVFTSDLQRLQLGFSPKKELSVLSRPASAFLVALGILALIFILDVFEKCGILVKEAVKNSLRCWRQVFKQTQL